ncbi:MAG TPA: MFS transporter [Chlamydiales bacterium]|nr:MAG: hypothetical protein A3F67_10270 [Verrucomicrobia bacterium RIFCSPHIGHO2_12_FULL_41_10]HLB52654.1 MFS transporter [Chlamydiales bacterium]
MKSEKAFSPSLLVVLYSILSLFVLNAALTTIGAPFIENELGADRTLNFYPFAFFAFGAFVTVPLTKPLFSKFGIYRTLTGALLLFSLTNLLTGMMPTYFFLNLFRWLAGLTTGPCFALLNQGIYLLVPKEKRILTAWIFSTIVITMPVIGGVWGGVMAYVYHWQSPFFLNSVLALFLIRCLKPFKKDLELPYPHNQNSFDWVGWWSYFISVNALTFAIATCQQLDWYRSPLLVAAILIGLPTFGFFILRSLYHPNPVYNLQLLKNPLIQLASFSLIIIFMTYFGVQILLNIWLTFDVQFTPNWIAALLAIMAIVACFPYLIITDWFSRFDPRLLLLIATLILMSSCFFTSTFWYEINIGRIIFARFLAGISFAFSFPTLIQIMMKFLPEENRIDAQELFQGIRNLASGLGASIFNIMWHRQSVFYHERLNEGLNLQNNQVQTVFMQKKILQVPGDPFAKLNLMLDDQSWTLALEDVFFLMGWMAFFLFLLIASTFLFRREVFFGKL